MNLTISLTEKVLIFIGSHENKQLKICTTPEAKLFLACNPSKKELIENLD